MGKPKTKILFGRLRHRRENNIKMYVKGIKREDLDWLKAGMGGEGFCRPGNEPSVYVKTCGIYRLAEGLLVSQAVLFHGVVRCRNVGTVCDMILQAISCQRPVHSSHCHSK